MAGVYVAGKHSGHDGGAGLSGAGSDTGVFFLKDRDVILLRLSSFLPEERPLMDRIWAEVNMEFANFVRGKAIEILIVGSVTYVSLKFLGVDYAALLSMLVGVSVVIPYIGAAVVTVPIAMVGLFQFGWTDQFVLLMVVYLIIQAIDGNILVPLLFSEVVDLHPVTIILSVLVLVASGAWGRFLCDSTGDCTQRRCQVLARSGASVGGVPGSVD